MQFPITYVDETVYNFFGALFQFENKSIPITISVHNIMKVNIIAIIFAVRRQANVLV